MENKKTIKIIYHFLLISSSFFVIKNWINKQKPTNVDMQSNVKNYLKKYRAEIISLQQKNQSGFDKTLLTLSGGSLGFTLTFMRDILKISQADYKIILIVSWIVWGLSLCALLAGYHYSVKAMKKTIKQIDEGIIYEVGIPGEPYSSIVRFCNNFGFILYILGVAGLILFISLNLEVL